MTRSVSSQIKLKRVYDPVSRADGTRILVDRLWPRGLRKEETWIDHWIKDLAPSTALRKWFCHDIELRKRYRAEIAGAKGANHLLFGARDELHNDAVVLRELLARQLASATRTKAAGKPRRSRFAR